jgi:ERF superfamily protein
MQRSSESIAKLAAALAKAQGELINPEKSLTATIKTDGGASQQTFRYAPLSSGLEIVRKTLGQHEIAVVQTTSTDPAAGMITLTTMLAHASGEWIASEWPVCAITETSAPRRLGAALTYARRYALFTLVGIAGEDDMDAPDLAMPTPQKQLPEPASGNGTNRLNGNGHHSARPSSDRAGAMARRPAASVLDSTASVALGDRLVAEIDAFECLERATEWAQRSMAEKNSLLAADARRVEDAFQARLERLSASPSDAVPQRNAARSRRTKGVDKSALTLPEPRRVRDHEHLQSVAQKACLICGRQPSDPHHLRFAQSRAMGQKVSDEFTVPLCRGHHRELHRSGDEAAWWNRQGIDPAPAARALWLESHPLPGMDSAAAAASDPTLGPQSPERMTSKVV